MSIDSVANKSEEINSKISSLRGGSDEIDYPYVIFQVFDNKFAISCKHVVSIEQFTPTTEIVHSAREVRGVSYYKNEPISIFDLRAVFGLISREDYINNVVNLPGRVQEYEEYAQTLEECVYSGLPFTLEVNPRECGFGKWLYGTRDKAAPEVRGGMDYIEPLHEEFHKKAELIRDALSSGRSDDAAKHLEKTRALKNEITNKLGELHETMHKSMKELNLILQLEGKKIGLVFDEPDSVEEIDEIQLLPPSVVMTKYIKRMGLGKKNRNIIFILEAEEFGNY
jgi:chemotaxis signal transduction protein